ncbi:MAG: hypothetical protein IT384_18415 [Deltaproteobacteria bacterium]|nr:hypothetical protein [Deltaproteobacteria bacterium]
MSERSDERWHACLTCRRSTQAPQVEIGRARELRERPRGAKHGERQRIVGLDPVNPCPTLHRETELRHCIVERGAGQREHLVGDVHIAVHDEGRGRGSVSVDPRDLAPASNDDSAARRDPPKQGRGRRSSAEKPIAGNAALMAFSLIARSWWRSPRKAGSSRT